MVLNKTVKKVKVSFVKNVDLTIPELNFLLFVQKILKNIPLLFLMIY